MITPTTEIPTATARLLGLSDAPELRHIGYWRDSQDGSDGYAIQALRAAERDLVAFQDTGRPPYITGETVDEPYLQRRVEASALELELSRSLPWPGDHLDPEMPEDERHRLAAQLFEHNASITFRYCSPSWDRLGWPHDAAKPWKCFSWGAGLGSGEVKHSGWVWPEGLFRYVQKYGLVLPHEFLVDVGAALAGQAPA